MKIIVLAENTTREKTLKPIHGLSIFLETSNHKVLFDLGPDDTFLHNAQKLGVVIPEIDTVVISHGHCDHGGALSNFLKINDKAKIYLHRQAFEPHYYKVLFVKKEVGLDKSLIENDRFIFTDETMQIDNELFLFSDVKDSNNTKSSRVILKKTSKGFEQDDFAHEQNLIVNEEGKSVLFSGCSHKGIVNILNTAEKHALIINTVFGGFHLYNPITKKAEPQKVVETLTNELALHETIYYTGHCTGVKAFELMRRGMGEKVQYLSTGMTIEI